MIDKNSATVAASVQAVNNTIMAAGAGSAALDMAKKQGDKSAAIAGAVAINISGNATRAYADNSIISDARSFSALALSGGEQTSVGIGLAINQSADKDKAASAAGSVSIAVVTDLVDAHVSGSTITVDPALISCDARLYGCVHRRGLPDHRHRRRRWFALFRRQDRLRLWPSLIPRLAIRAASRRSMRMSRI